MSTEAAPAATAPPGTGTPVTRPPLAALLGNRRWVRRTLPFPHVVADRVFVDDFYAELAAEFGRIERDHPEAFRRDMEGYDASGTNLGHHRDGPFGVFVSREWHDMLARLAGIQATGDISGSLHHHDPGGASGWPHNDLNPGWFAAPAPGPDDVQIAGVNGVSYHHGRHPQGVEPRETVRAVSVLYYLGNPPWQRGDGGETGLYETLGATQPAAAVPPLNNSLVMFECTPFSWHGFLSNRRHPRNSVVMWLHRDKSEVVARWGEQSIVYW